MLSLSEIITIGYSLRPSAWAGNYKNPRREGEKGGEMMELFESILRLLMQAAEWWIIILIILFAIYIASR